MSTNSSPKTGTAESIILKPLHRLPLLISAFGLTLLAVPINNLPGILISIFGLFLLLQSFILRLEFTSSDLVVLQLGRELRRFPFQNWLAWRLFLPQLPGIFYFRETASPHLLPILFDPTTLREQLELRVGELEVPKASPNTLS